MEIKKAVYRELDEVTPGTILASNTSSLSITEMGRETSARARSSASTSSTPPR